MDSLKSETIIFLILIFVVGIKAVIDGFKEANKKGIRMYTNSESDMVKKLLNENTELKKQLAKMKKPIDGKIIELINDIRDKID